jgi:CRP/FNR family cyclic AMP-dependent transcriptional regulator
MFVADGAVDVKRSNLDGREVIVSRLGQGDFFGEISILTESNRTADVSAAEDSMLLILQAHDFETLLSAHREFARAFLVHLAARVAAASTRIADLALLDVYCRVYKVLQSLATLNPAGELHVAERPTHRDLAAMVGTSREMVTRALTRLSEDKIIQSDGPALKIVGRLAVY